LKVESGKLKNVVYYYPIARHAELVSASVDFGIFTLSKIIGKIHHDIDAEP